MRVACVLQLREEHSVSQTKLHTSYNKKIDQLEIKLSTLEKEREEQEREHQEEAAQAAAQRSSLAIIEQVLWGGIVPLVPSFDWAHT
jgi:predicted Holliday junction resolvase-like endonuclease